MRTKYKDLLYMSNRDAKKSSQGSLILNSINLILVNFSKRFFALMNNLKIKDYHKNFKNLFKKPKTFKNKQNYRSFILLNQKKMQKTIF